MKIDYLIHLLATLKRMIPATLLLGALGFGLTSAAHAQFLYVVNSHNYNTLEYSTYIGKYDAASGAAIDSRFVELGATTLVRDAVASGNSLYVAYRNTDMSYSVGKYNASTGTPINSTFVTGLDKANSMALSGSNLYVSGSLNIQKYHADTGAVINAYWDWGTSSSYPTYDYLAASDDYVYGFNSGGLQRYSFEDDHGRRKDPTFVTNASGKLDGGFYGMALSGNNLFFSRAGGNGTATVGQLDANTGDLITSSFITGLTYPHDIVAFGNDLYVIDSDENTGKFRVGKYNATTGAAIDANFITGLDRPTQLMFATAVPEPGSYALLLGLLSLGGILCFRRRRART